MKRLWPLAVLMLLALPLRAQEEEESAPAAEVQEPAGQEDAAPAEEAEPAPVAEPNSSGSDPSQEEGASKDRPKEEPLVSVKVVPAAGEEGDEESVAPAPPKKKIESTVLVGRTPKKGKPAKAKKAAVPVAATAKAPVIPPAPPPPPPPAVPLTPITPRNP